MAQELHGVDSATDWSGFAFVASVLQLSSVTSFEILPGHSLQRANEKQLAKIREVLTQANPILGFYSPRSLYEKEPVESRSSTGVQVTYVDLPQESWRYNVVTFSPNNGHVSDIEEASNLTEIPLEMPFFFFNKGGQGGHTGRIADLFSATNLGVKATRVTESQLEDLRSIYSGIQDIGRGYPQIKRAASMLDSLKMLPQHSESRVLGLFAIIEMLITHNPKLEDRGDSITHQMKSKIPLVSHRFSRPLNYGAYFGECEEDEIWGDLYSYRSAVAHGGIADFENRYRRLRNMSTTLAFLKEAVRLLLRHGLKEPQLLKDLREC